MATKTSPLNVVLCWHMHQPQYKEPDTGQYHLPWTYLHATKDYVDMAAHLEDCPGARAVVNFAPILLEQLSDYADQLQSVEVDGSDIRDPLLSVLCRSQLDLTDEQKQQLIRASMKANEDRLIKRFPAFEHLVGIARKLLEDPLDLLYIGDQFLFDLVTWYHLAWLGETVHRHDSRAKRLVQRARAYCLEDRMELLELIGELVGGVLERYRRLAQAGKVELAVSPYAHPILPLLLDLHSAREAMPKVTLPAVERYPGGEDRAREHVRRGLEVFEKTFGFRPRGCWPSEGSVSVPALALLEEYGFEWAASGESVYRNSILFSDKVDKAADYIHHACQMGDGRLNCFFRDDGLSDLIGFTYADWHADDAVANLVHHLENIAGQSSDPERVVSIIMDGENAWEYYPVNAYYFISALYKKLSEHPLLNLTTYSACLDGGLKPARLPELVAGSWVYGTFSTWIGDPGKNRGWEMLADAKRAYDKVMAAGKLSKKQRLAADSQLAVCEGSDWFWWFGDYNPADTVSDFECLFRRHLGHLYDLLKLPRPAYLEHAFTFGQGAPSRGGVMRRGTEAGG